MKIDSKVIPDHILRLMAPSDRPHGVAGALKEEIAMSHDIKSERRLQADIANYLNLNNIAFYNPRSDKKSTVAAGLPDFALAIKGKPIAFECKTSAGKVHEHQAMVHEKMRANGWQVHIIRSLREAIKVVREEMCKNP